MRYSLRTLLLVIAALSCVFAAVRGCHEMRMAAGVVEPKYWPEELKTILSDFNIKNSDVDVRFGGAFISEIWKMKSSPDILQAHIDAFHLSPVSPNGPEAQGIRDCFPLAWDWPDHKNIRCFANPVGLPPIPDGGNLYILIQDDKNNVIYGYHFFNF